VIVYLGLDDTDTVDLGGTGQLARSLALRLRAELPGCRIEGVSRHQLLQDPRVPCTRRNRCSCVVVDVEPSGASRVAPLGRTHILDGSVHGSDPGLCVAEECRIGPDLLDFARRAKQELVSPASALELARRAGVLLEPLGGTGDGVIGALAAIGLRRGGSDGWLTLWEGIDRLEGVLSVERLLAGGVDRVEDEHGRRLPASELVDTAGRARPAVREGRRVLLVRRSESGTWRSVKPERKGA
jgi:tRNA(Ile2) C34 agmatinyltransferase TiaS